MPNCAHNSPIVRSSCSYSNTKRSFSSITLLVFQGIMTVVTPLPFVAVSEMPPVYFVRHPPGLYHPSVTPPPPSPFHTPLPYTCQHRNKKLGIAFPAVIL